MPVLPVHGHLRPERGHFLGEGAVRLVSQQLRPLDQHVPRRGVETRDLLVAQARGELRWRETRPMQDLVGIRVADPAEEPRIRE